MRIGSIRCVHTLRKKREINERKKMRIRCAHPPLPSNNAIIIYSEVYSAKLCKYLNCEVMYFEIGALSRLSRGSIKALLRLY